MKNTFKLYHILTNLSFCLDFNKEGISQHHKRVAHMSLDIANEIGLSAEEKNLLFTASIIHDVGVSTWKGKEQLAEFEIDEPWDHCENGFEMVERIDFLKSTSKIILCHHDKYSGKNKSGFAENEIPMEARIIHLVDRIDVLIKPNIYILHQCDGIIESLERLDGYSFDPELVTAFKHLAHRESFWLDLTSPYLGPEQSIHNMPEVALDDKAMKQVAELFATVIDKKSPFTNRHSKSVAGVALHLAVALGFNSEELTLMEIAGLLHDLGKLSVPEEILEKPGSLTTDEFAIIRQHSYYTYQILKSAGVPSPIPQWAAFHHEKPDGSGYPFHLDGSKLSKGSRIMAVADVFTALREDRPYRPGMNKSKIEDIMNYMALDNALDKETVKVLFDIYDKVDELPIMLDPPQF